MFKESNNQLNSGGFTLVEVVISTALLSMTLLVATLGYIGIVKFQARASTIQTIQQKSRQTIEIIARDVRNSSLYRIENGGKNLILPDNLDLNKYVCYYAQGTSLYRQVYDIDCPVAAIPANGGQILGQELRLINFNSQPITASGGALQPILIELRVGQLDATITDEGNPYFYEYEVNSVVRPRR